MAIRPIIPPAARHLQKPGRRAWAPLPLLALLIALLALPCSGLANHLVGYDWQVHALGQGRYRLRLNLYTDPVGGNNATGDQSITVASYEQNPGPGGADRLVETFVLPRTSITTLPGGAPPCEFAGVPVRFIVYEAAVQLNLSQYGGSASGYYWAWERCCRNQSVSNLVDPLNMGTAAYLEFQPGFTGLPAQTFNSAPEFVHAPPGDALCLGEAAAISFAATDPNGDSLTYSLVPALAGHTSQLNNTLSVPNPAPYPLVRYSTGFSAQRPLPGTFHLDPRTGLLTGTPALPGIFQVAVQVEEWYQGRRIGANRREFEIVVVNCPANTPPELTRVSPPGDTVVISGAADRCLTVRVTDPDPGQTLTVRALDGAPVTISPAQVTIQYPPQPVDLTVCWADCSEPGPTLLRLVVGDNGCRSAPADTLLVPVRLAPSANRPPTLRRVPALPDTLVVAAGQELAFEVEAFDPDPDLLVLSLRLAGATGRPAGLTAEPLQGIGLVRTAVRWVPACDASRPGPYVFWVRVSDGGCQPTDSLRVRVRVTPPAPVDPTPLPNVITPNQDGRNDCFSLGARSESAAIGACEEAFGSVEIYNRWGRQVFTSPDPGFCWTAPGLSPGTYYYLVHWSGHVQRGFLAVEK